MPPLALHPALLSSPHTQLLRRYEQASVIRRTECMACGEDGVRAAGRSSTRPLPVFSYAIPPFTRVLDLTGRSMSKRCGTSAVLLTFPHLGPQPRLAPINLSEASDKQHEATQLSPKETNG